MLRVIAPGALTLVQDAGRRAAQFGVGRGGAADRAALAAANAAVGNAPEAAALETVLDGLTLEALRPCMVAVAGTGQPVVPLALGAGGTVRVDAGDYGLRRYVAVRGGIETSEFLGSRSADLLAGFGTPLRAGDLINVGAHDVGFPEVVVDPVIATDVRVHPGPRADWIDGDFTEVEWTVTPSSDRTAVRFEGPKLSRAINDELAPEGLLPGAVQVPPSGQPIVFLYDHPVTGGYPVIGVVDPADLRFVAQARPGRTLRFVRTVGQG